MAKVYIVTDADLKSLLTELDRDPKFGELGGSSTVLSKVEQAAYEEWHAKFNMRVRRWISDIQK